MGLVMPSDTAAPGRLYQPLALHRTYPARWPPRLTRGVPEPAII
jgi:hypothetical protein